MRILKIAGAAVTAVVVVAVLLAVIGIPSGFLTSTIQERVERDTGYRLKIAGATKISLWPSLNVTLNDVTLSDPLDHEGAARLTAGSIQADVTLASLWSGKPVVTELNIVRPIVNVPLQRERARDTATAPKAPTSTGKGDADAGSPAIDHITVSDGTIAFANTRDRIDDRIEAIAADIRIGADRVVKASGNARAGGRPLKFDIKTTAPAPPMERKNFPTELTLDAPGLLQAPLTAKAEARLNGSVVQINGVTGTVGDGAFNGWASVDLSSKPLIKLDLDFQRLDLAASSRTGASAQDSQISSSAPSSLASQGWSNAPIQLSALNYVDVQAKVSAAELNVGDAHFAPAAIDAALGSGVLKVRFSNLGAYGGQASGELDVDASTASPTYALHTDLTSVRALPLLRSAAGFDKLDGKLQAKIAVRSTGTSQRAIMSGLGGAVFAVFQDGAIRGLNVAAMIRSLTASPLAGWQDGNEQNTDLTQLSASFKIENGQATSSDLNLVGPLVRMTGAGTIDLGTKTLAFRVEPKLVMTTEGQGRAADPVGFGIPVVIDGPWATPRIYPDMAGILDNPDAAYAKLKEMGKGLFGPGGAGLSGAGLGSALGGLSGGLGGNLPGGLGGALPGGNTGNATGGDPLGGKLGETLGNLLQQGLGGSLGQGLDKGTGGGLIQGRNIPVPAAPASAAPPSPPSLPAPPPAQSDSTPQPPRDSPAMNDVLRQLFNR